MLRGRIRLLKGWFSLLRGWFRLAQASQRLARAVKKLAQAISWMDGWSDGWTDMDQWTERIHPLFSLRLSLLLGLLPRPRVPLTS